MVVRWIVTGVTTDNVRFATFCDHFKRACVPSFGHLAVWLIFPLLKTIDLRAYPWADFVCESVGNAWEGGYPCFFGLALAEGLASWLMGGWGGDSVLFVLCAFRG
jgi:hypothetical protein